MLPRRGLQKNENRGPCCLDEKWGKRLPEKRLLETVGLSRLSNEGVNRRRRVRRALRVLGWAVLAIAAMLAAMVPIQQRRLRMHAAGVLSDLHQIELRQTKWSEAKEMVERWREWGDYSEECGENLCRHSVELYDGLSGALWDHPGVAQYFVWLNGAYEFLGGRVVRFTARLEVVDGVVWGKGIVAYIHVSQRDDADGLFGGYGYDLIAEAGSQSRLDPLGSISQIVLHPEYMIGTPGGCTSCLMVYARFTPYADSFTVRRLMDVNLSCIDRWHPCRYRPDIMPLVWNELTERRPHQQDMRELFDACEFPLEVMGRDADHVVVVDALSTKAYRTSPEHRLATVRLKEQLKGATFWNVGEVKKVPIFDGAINRQAAEPIIGVKKGSAYILAFDRVGFWQREASQVLPYQCGVLPATESNLAAVQRGIERDFMAKYRAEPKPPSMDGLE